MNNVNNINSNNQELGFNKDSILNRVMISRKLKFKLN